MITHAVPNDANNGLTFWRSKDWGATFEAGSTLIANRVTFAYSDAQRLRPIVGGACDPTGKVIAVTWTSIMTGGGGNYDTRVMISRDSGNTWTAPIRINDNTGSVRMLRSWVVVDKRPALAMRGGISFVLTKN